MHIKKQTPFIFLFLSVLSLTISPSFAALDSTLDSYIIVLKNNAITNDISNDYGLHKTHDYKHALNGMAVMATTDQINKVKNDNRVLFIQQDGLVEITTQPLPTGINRVDAELNPLSKIDGIDERVDIDIAILDTGISLHPDLNVVGGINFVTSDRNDWDDRHGHGTHVSGTAAGLDNDIGVVGVAPGARLFAVKVLGDGGGGTFASLVAGIDWITSQSEIIDVVNVSLGGFGSDDGNCGLTNGDAVHLAICNSVAKGVVYSVAAGNSFRDASSFIPASYDEVITVSAIADFDGLSGGRGSPTCRSDVDDTFADFSNFGKDVDIAAPGVCIFSTYKGGVYTTLSGTSMSAPHVTGATALYIFQNGKPLDKAGTETVKNGLINLSTPQRDPDGFTEDPDSFSERLLNAASSIDTPTPPPPPPIDTIPPTATIIAPIDGSIVSGMITITVVASDDIGIQRVDVFIDGKQKRSLTTAPYEVKWQTKSSHLTTAEIIAIAYDAAGNSAPDSVTITLNN